MEEILSTPFHVLTNVTFSLFLAILFEDAIILGAENDTMLMRSTGMSSTVVPYSTLERTVSD